MPDYKWVDVDATTYLYNEQSCSVDPGDISQAMGAAFATVATFIGQHGIASMGRPLSVYYTHDEAKMTFRAGFIVSADDANSAAGDVHAGTLPAGRVLHFVHRGPYATLRDSYGDMMEHLAKKGMTVGAPSWEVYTKGPDDVASKDDLETDVYVTVQVAEKT